MIVKTVKSSSEQSQGRVSSWDSRGTGSSRTWLLADSSRISGKARTTAEGDDNEGEREVEGEEMRGRMGKSGRILNESDSARRVVHSCSGNTKMTGFIFT